MSLGDGCFIRDIYIIEDLCPEYNLLNMKVVHRQRDSLELYGTKYNTITYAQIGQGNRKLQILNALGEDEDEDLCEFSYVVIPVPGDDNFSVQNYKAKHGIRGDGKDRYLFEHIWFYYCAPDWADELRWSDYDE